MILPDPVPLGVCGVETVSLSRYLDGGEAKSEEVLLNDADRIAYVARRLAEAFQRPLTSPGSESLARSVLQQLGEADRAELFESFAQKGIETLRDGERHDRMAVSADAPHLAVWFVAWSGTHREVQSERLGNYLGMLTATAHGLTRRGIVLAGFLEIDAFLRESPDPNDPVRPLEEVFEVDVEFSFLPGFALGFPEDEPNPLPKVLLVNRGLCSPEERQLLGVSENASGSPLSGRFRWHR